MYLRAELSTRPSHDATDEDDELMAWTYVRLHRYVHARVGEGFNLVCNYRTTPVAGGEELRTLLLDALGTSCLHPPMPR
jgi:hypothetical protein